MKISFNKKYFTAGIFLLLTEIFIALYIQDSWIRPYGGDFLVVILLYCLVKSFLKISFKKAIFGVLLFSWLVEGLQYLHILRLLKIDGITFLTVILGSHFEWLDILVYTLAAVAIFLIEVIRQRSFTRTPKGT